MQYIYSICNSLIKRASKTYSSPIIIPAIRDLFIYIESSLLQGTMIKTSNNENLDIKDLMDSLKETDRDIQSILNNIEYLKDNLGVSINNEQNYKLLVL